MNQAHNKTCGLRAPSDGTINEYPGGYEETGSDVCVRVLRQKELLDVYAWSVSAERDHSVSTQCCMSNFAARRYSCT
jgi:hypothetical protein